VVKTGQKLYVVMTVHFGMKLCNAQRNAQVFKFIYVFTSALHVSGLLLALLQRQVYKSGSGSSLLGMVSVPERGHHNLADLNPCRICTSTSEEDGLKEKPETCKAEVNS
jgi:hypothetical protein